MKNLTNYINEASRNEKRRTEKYIKNMFLNGKEYGNIKSFGIITSQNPDATGKVETDVNKAENKKLYAKFKSELKNGKFKVVPTLGKFGDPENSFVIINVTINDLKKWAAKYSQTSFFFCHPEDNGLVCEYWMKSNTNEPAGADNPYEKVEETTNWSETPDADNYFTAIGKKFKFTINCKCFESASEEITAGLAIMAERMNCEDTNLILNESMINCGYRAWGMRNVINKNILTN